MNELLGFQFQSGFKVSVNTTIPDWKQGFLVCIIAQLNCGVASRPKPTAKECCFSEEIWCFLSLWQYSTGLLLTASCHFEVVWRQTVPALSALQSRASEYCHKFSGDLYKHPQMLLTISEEALMNQFEGNCKNMFCSSTFCSYFAPFFWIVFCFLPIRMVEENLYPDLWPHFQIQSRNDSSSHSSSLVEFFPQSG